MPVLPQRHDWHSPDSSLASQVSLPRARLRYKNSPPTGTYPLKMYFLLKIEVFHCFFRLPNGIKDYSRWGALFLVTLPTTNCLHLEIGKLPKRKLYSIFQGLYSFQGDYIRIYQVSQCNLVATLIVSSLVSRCFGGCKSTNLLIYNLNHDGGASWWSTSTGKALLRRRACWNENHLPGNRLIAGHFLKNIIWETLLLHPSFEKSRVQLATVQ